MKNKNYTLFLVVIGILVAISIGMTAANYFILQNAEVEYKYYYRANQDITPYTELSSSMFDKVAVPNTITMSGMVENLADVVGKYNSAEIAEGEYLVSSYITKDNSEAGKYYTIQITGSYVADVAYNDNVDVWLLASDNSLSLLFEGKKIYKAKTTAISDATDASYETAASMYIHVDEKEMIQYYSSLRDNKLIIIPYNANYDIREVVSSNGLSNKENENKADDAVVNTYDYIAEDGDTFETIASNFQVDLEVLKGVNPNVTVIFEGDIIKIPY